MDEDQVKQYPEGTFETERWAAEPPRQRQRSAFARDRARVLHSSALRRLSGKTQVVGPGTNDFSRTRLTHSLEVGQVGREMAVALGCSPDIVEAACLAHDLGHAPFGHNGESVLHDLAKDIGGFEGNAQSFRVLTRLEPKVVAYESDGKQRSAGLNLTRSCLDAVMKYPWGIGEGPAGTSKFGYYDDDRPVVDWVRRGAPAGKRCLEAQVMDFADDSAFSVHDLEDAIVGGWVDPADLLSDTVAGQVMDLTERWKWWTGERWVLEKAWDSLIGDQVWVRQRPHTRADLAQLKLMTSTLVGQFCTGTLQATRQKHGTEAKSRYQADLIIPEQVAAQVAVLKGIVGVYVIGSRDQQQVYARQVRVIKELVCALLAAGDGCMEAEFADDWRQADHDDARLRVVIDQVASLTDASAHSWHTRLCTSP